MRKLLHHANAIVFAVLLVSGFLLHLSILRGPLSAYRLMLIRTHYLAGELFGLLHDAVSVLWVVEGKQDVISGFRQS